MVRYLMGTSLIGSKGALVSALNTSDRSHGGVIFLRTILIAALMNLLMYILSASVLLRKALRAEICILRVAGFRPFSNPFVGIPKCLLYYTDVHWLCRHRIAQMFSIPLKIELVGYWFSTAL